MSTNARLSLIGLYNYMPTLFDALTLPDGYNKETFINSLLLEHGEKCVMYSDPDFMYAAIGVWGKKWELELTKIYEALTANYDPIYNYDRYEDIDDSRIKDNRLSKAETRTATDTPDYHDESTSSASGSSDSNGHVNTVTADNGTITKSGTNEHTVSADNSSAYQAESKDLIDSEDTETRNGSNDQSSANNDSFSNSSNVDRQIHGTTQNLSETANDVEDVHESETNTHTAHIYGNIGVTTSAQMVTEVLKQRFTYNLYTTAARLFANELLIGIY